MSGTLDFIFPQTFSHTTMSDVWKCEYYWFRTYCQVLRGAARSPDLIAGGHIATACEITRKAFYFDGVEHDEAVELGKDFILTAEDTGDDLKSNDRVAQVFERYFKKYRMDGNIAPMPLVDGTFAVEYKFSLDLGIPHPDLPDTNICFTGKLDGLFKKKSTFGDKIYVLDEKTTKSVKRVKGTDTPDYAAEEELYKTSGQFIGYHMAARTLGVKPDGTIVRRLPIMAKPEPCYELVLPINDFIIDRYQTALEAKIGELVEKYKWLKATGKDPSQAFFPIYNEGCNAFSRPCVFKIGCSDRDGEEQIKASFKQVVYDRDKGVEIPLSEYKQLRGLV